MYHFVRDGARVAARTLAEFEAQLDHVAERYTVVGCADVLADNLPENACLLTFDDGLREHAEVVAPALARRGLTGVFCIPVVPVLERRVQDTQKSQFVIAASDDHAELGRRLLELVRQYRDEWEIPNDDGLRAANTPPHRLDPPNKVFLKRMLQDGLPDKPRREVLDTLFAELVTDDEHAFAAREYVSLEDVQTLAAQGMDIAGHGYEHRRLALLSEEEQRHEIAKTFEFLTLVNDAESQRWTFCYPYGSRSATTVELLRTSGCALGLTTDVGRANSRSDLFELPRIDTNDLQSEVVDPAI
jgi:peptidoglycan/xylan/chitin deacetylase (PgdA/CDA1 family)